MKLWMYLIKKEEKNAVFYPKIKMSYFEWIVNKNKIWLFKIFGSKGCIYKIRKKMRNFILYRFKLVVLTTNSIWQYSIWIKHLKYEQFQSNVFFNLNRIKKINPAVGQYYEKEKP